MQKITPFAFVVVALIHGFATASPAETGRERAIVELTAAGFTWDGSKRAIAVTDVGREKLTSLGGIQKAMRLLEPRTLDLTSCSLLAEVDGVRGVRSLQSINLSNCPALKNVDGVAGIDGLKKIYLFESPNVATESMDALEKRFPKSYIVLPDGTGLNPPRAKD